MSAIITPEIEAKRKRPTRKPLQRAAYKQLLIHEEKAQYPHRCGFCSTSLSSGDYFQREKTRTDGKKDDVQDQDLIDAVTALRDREIVPDDWIVDETRAVDHWLSADTVADLPERTPAVRKPRSMEGRTAPGNHHPSANHRRRFQPHDWF